MYIKVKKLTETAKIPTKAYDEAACFDLYVDCPNESFRSWGSGKGEAGYEEEINGVKIRPHTAYSFHTGICTEIPRGYFCAVFARSGLGIKHNLRPSNCIGIIDSDYRGEWMVALYNDSDETKIIRHGDRVAQFAVLPVLNFQVEEVSELSSTRRGEGGFGSSGQ